MQVQSILIGLSAICLALFLYPYLLYPLVLRLMPTKAVQCQPTNLSASILFCTFNEILCLRSKIDNLRELKLGRPNLQILVYDDASDDGSYDLLLSVPDVLTTIRGAGRTGKAAGMKQLVKLARGDILVLTDADVLLSPHTIDLLLPYYADSEVGGVCSTVRMMSDPASPTSIVGSTYWNLDDHLQRLESATGNVMGASGALFSVRRSLYPSFPDTVQDDFTVSMSVIFQGRRLIKATDVVAYTKGVQHSTEELQRKVRIGARAFHTHLFLRPQLRQLSFQDRFKYASRKMLRWFGGFFLALSILFGLAAVALVSVPLSALTLMIGSVVLLVSLSAERGTFARLGQVLLAIFATTFGVIQALRGRTVTIWSPAKSR